MTMFVERGVLENRSVLFFCEDLLRRQKPSPLQHEVEANVDLVLRNKGQNVLDEAGGEGDSTKLAVEEGNHNVDDKGPENGAHSGDQRDVTSRGRLNVQVEHGNAQLEHDGGVVGAGGAEVEDVHGAVEGEDE